MSKGWISFVRGVLHPPLTKEISSFGADAIRPRGWNFTEALRRNCGWNSGGRRSKHFDSAQCIAPVTAYLLESRWVFW